MLKKMFKKFLALALTVAMVATTCVTPVSATTWVPKKSHTDAEVQERALFLIDKADELAFSPYSGFAGDFGSRNGSNEFANRHSFHPYMAYAMCELLLATPNLKSACSSQTISKLRKARNTWKAAYVSDMMYAFYHQVWSDTYLSVDHILGDVKCKNPYIWDRFFKGNIIMPHLNLDKVTKKATVSYNRVKNYIAKYQKYNPTVASKLTKWNTTQYNTYKKLAKQMKGFTADKFIEATSGVTGIFEVAQGYYGSCWTVGLGVLKEEDKLQTKVSNWYWIDMGMTPFNGSKDSPFNVFGRNVKYGTW